MGLDQTCCYLAVIALLRKDSTAVGKCVPDRRFVVDRVDNSLKLLPCGVINVNVLVVAKLGRQPGHVWWHLKVHDVVGSTALS